VAFLPQKRAFFRAACANYTNSRQNRFRLQASGKVLPSILLAPSVDKIDGCSMKGAITTLVLPDEHFVVQVDGQARSEHRRFVGALIAGLLLRNEFPQHEVKVLEAETSGQAADVVH